MAEAQEVEGLDRVLHRLAMTDDEKLEGLLVKLLPIVLGKLQAPGPAVQRKVLDILSHVNKRLKPLPQAQLPLEALVQLYCSPTAGAMVRNFALVYLETAMERAAPEGRFAQLGPLLKDLSTRPAAHQEMLLRLSARGLCHLAHSGNAFALGTGQDFSNRFPWLAASAAPDRALFLRFAERLMLYQPPSVRHHASALAAAQAAMQAGMPQLQQAVQPMEVDAAGAAPPPPPGLSRKDVALVEGKVAPDGSTLQARKLGVLNFTAAAELPPGEVLTLYLAASCDPSDAVSRRGEELLKKRCAIDTSRPAVDTERVEVITPLFELFHGSMDDESLDRDLRRTPAGPALRSRLLTLFCKTLAAANCFPHTLTTVAQCLYSPGSTPRLRQQGMEFAVWVFKHADPAQLAPAASTVLDDCLTLLDSPAGGAGALDASTLALRSFTYQAVGQLAQRQPAALRGRTDVATRFFAALAVEPPGVRAAVQEAVSSLATAFAGSSGPAAEELLLLLEQSLQSREEAVRGAAVQWAVRLFPFDHVQARYICILGAADSRFQLADAAVDGLTLAKYPKSSTGSAAFSATAAGEGADGAVSGSDAPQQSAYPPVQAMLSCLLQRQPVLGRPVEELRSLALPSKSFLAAIRFLERCRHQQGGTLQEGLMAQYLVFLENALVREAPSDLHAAALAAMLATSAHDRAALGTAYAHRPSLFLRLLSHVDASARDAAARLLGTLSGSMAPDQAAALLQSALGMLRGGEGRKPRLEEADGAAAAAGYVAAQCMAGRPAIRAEVLTAALTTLRSVLEDEAAEVTLRCTAALALGCAALPLADASVLSGDAVRAGAAAATDAALSALPDAPGIAAATAALIQARDKAATGPPQRAVQALGLLCHSQRAPEVLRPAVAALLELRTCKQEAVLFAAGEALCLAYGGVPVPVDDMLQTPFASLAAWMKQQEEDKPQEGTSGGNRTNTPPQLQQEEDAAMDEASLAATAPGAPPGGGEAPEASPIQQLVLGSILDEYVSNSRPEVRCAGVTWLLSLLTFCAPASPPLLALLPRASDALCTLLADDNGLTQEAASRGLAACYELADETTRAALVNSLVATLTGAPAAKKRRAGGVTADTQVFEPGALGSVPGGGSLSTYKEICALANDMGQPDLVYRFMQLANHNAAAEASRGAAFGFASVAKLAGGALQHHVGRLVPRLYRSLYDPQPRVREAMHHIWTAIVDDPRTEITRHFDAIAAALLTDMTTGQWRTREAAASAAKDLIQGRSWPELRPHFTALWSACLRVIDDVKETVRQSGLALARSLRGLTLRLADPESTPVAFGKEAVAAALPLLLEQGLPSRVDEVRLLAVDTTARLVKAAGPDIVRPHLAALVPAMLESLSGLEDARLNYVEQHAERLGLNAGRLEAARVSAAQGSPVGDTLEACARYTDAAALQALAPRLSALVRRGVGINTRAGAGRFVAAVARRLGAEAAPAAPQLMRALQEAARSERSAAVRRAYAGANAVLAKQVSVGKMEKAVGEWLELYSGEDADVDARAVAGVLLRALSREAGDVFAAHAAAVAPVAYLAQFDEEESVASVWKEVWEESTASTGAGLRLHVGEVVARVTAGLHSGQWGRKKAAAAAVVRACADGGEALGGLAPALMQDLLRELPGRLWEGKEAVLAAIGALAATCAARLRQADPQLPGTVVAGLLEAAGKKKAAYKQAALEQLEAVLTAWEDEDHFAGVGPLVLEQCSAFVAAQGGAVPMDTDAAPPSTSTAVTSQPASSSTTTAAAPAAAAVPITQVAGCLGAAWAACGDATVREHADGVAQALTAVLEAATKGPDQVAVVQAAVRFAERCAAVPGGLLQERLPQVQGLLSAGIRLAADGKASQHREKALELVTALLPQVWAGLAECQRGQWREAVQEVLAREKLPALKSQAAAILAGLQG